MPREPDETRPTTRKSARTPARTPAGATPKDGPTKKDAAADIAQDPVVRSRRITKKKDFVDRATDRSGLKKADAKAAIDATLAILAEALAAGEELVLPPLGKLKVARERQHPKGRILMLRLQLSPEDASGSEPLAEAAE